VVGCTPSIFILVSTAIFLVIMGIYRTTTSNDTGASPHLKKLRGKRGVREEYARRVDLRRRRGKIKASVAESLERREEERGSEQLFAVAPAGGMNESVSSESLKDRGRFGRHHLPYRQHPKREHVLVAADETNESVSENLKKLIHEHHTTNAQKHERQQNVQGHIRDERIAADENHAELPLIRKKINSKVLHDASKNVFKCRDGSGVAVLNDNYCDCTDGSDEPATSACSHLLVQIAVFECADGKKRIFASRVGDGVRDCPDGSDER